MHEDADDDPSTRKARPMVANFNLQDACHRVLRVLAQDVRIDTAQYENADRAHQGGRTHGVRDTLSEVDPDSLEPSKYSRLGADPPTFGRPYEAEEARSGSPLPPKSVDSEEGDFTIKDKLQKVRVDHRSSPRYAKKRAQYAPRAAPGANSAFLNFRKSSEKASPVKGGVGANRRFMDSLELPEFESSSNQQTFSFHLR